MAMMAMTTNSSMSVNADLRAGLMAVLRQHEIGASAESIGREERTRVKCLRAASMTKRAWTDDSGIGSGNRRECKEKATEPKGVSPRIFGFRARGLTPFGSPT